MFANLLRVLLTTVPIAVAPAQEPGPAARYDVLPIEPVRVVAIEAATHPDPDGLPADAVVEIVGTILDFDPATDAHSVVGYLGAGATSSRSPQAAIDADGRFRLVLRGRSTGQDLDRAIVLRTERRPNRALPGAVRDWSSPLDVDSVPFLGFACHWRVRGSGAGPWKVDVGAIEKTPAPRVAVIHVRLPTEEACESDRYGLGLILDRGKYPTLSRRFAIPRGRALELFSWSINLDEVLHVFRDDVDESDGLRLWCPRFPIDARVEASLVLHHRVEFELNAESAREWRGFALLLPLDRLDWIQRLAEQSFFRSMSSDLQFLTSGPNSEPGAIVHVSRKLQAFRKPVAPTRFELILLEPLDSSGLPPRIVRMGEIDLAQVAASEVRIVLDLKAETARVVP